MILPRETRKLIHEANGRPVTIKWPETEHDPKRGHSYTIQGSGHRAGSASMLVCDIGKNGYVKVQVIDDPSRLRVSKARRPLDTKAAPQHTVEAHTEYEPGRISAEEEETLAMHARVQSERLRAGHRSGSEVTRLERVIRKREKKGKKSDVAEKDLARAVKRRDRAEEELGFAGPELAA